MARSAENITTDHSDKEYELHPHVHRALKRSVAILGLMLDFCVLGGMPRERVDEIVQEIGCYWGECEPAQLLRMYSTIPAIIRGTLDTK